MSKSNSSSYSVKQPNIFGRIGAGVGQGLAEQVPKEIERYRLSSGLQALEKESGNLTPTQFLTRALSIPGMTPEMTRQLGELSRQQARNQANIQSAQANKPQRIEPMGNESPLGEERQGVTTREPTEATLKPVIPREFNERHNAAAEKFNLNPARYNNEFQNALAEENMIDQALQERNVALQGKRTNEQGVQKYIEGELEKVKTTLGATVPGNVYDSIRQKAINSIKPKNKEHPELGGEGLTEYEAAEKYGKELDKISREYQQLENIGVGQMLFDDAKTNLANLKSVGDAFRNRGDEENLALSYEAKQQLSPEASAYLAYPISREKELNNALIKAPNISKGIPGFSKKELINRNENMTFQQIDEAIEKRREEYSYKVSKELASKLGKFGSPLAVGMQLKSMGYDPRVWMKYLNDNREKLQLTGRQERELSKQNTSWYPNLQDLWLFYNAGLDKLVEEQ